MINGTLAIMCVLTALNTDFSDFKLIDGLLFACMGMAVISTISLHVLRKRKDG